MVRAKSDWRSKMDNDKFWNSEELRRYLRLLRDVQNAQRDKMDLVRGRIESGYYLTDEIAQATAHRMLTSHGEPA